MIILIEKTISMKCAISKKGKTMLQSKYKMAYNYTVC